MRENLTLPTRKTAAYFCLLLCILQIACQAGSKARPYSADPSPTTSAVRNYEEKRELNDPFCCDDYVPETMKQAWAVFAKDGRYRLARPSDMKGGEAALRRPYAYTWGDLGYDRDPSQTYHLAAIVIDTTRNNETRFGVLIFSAPRGAKGAYRVYWLMRDKDLSEAFFSGNSGYLELVNQKDSFGGCDIRWNLRQMKYSCRQ